MKKGKLKQRKCNTGNFVTKTEFNSFVHWRSKDKIKSDNNLGL